MIRIIGSKAWRALNAQTLKASIVSVEDCGNIHASEVRDKPVIDASTVLLQDCDKNFVYYWLKPHIFPNAKTIYLASHPCEPVVLNRFPNTKIYLSDRYRREMRWANDNTELIPESEINLLKKNWLLTYRL